MVDGSIPAEQLSPVPEALHVDKALPPLELGGLLERASLSAPAGLLAPAAAKDEDVLVARPPHGGAHGPKAKTTLILWLLWTLCKVKDDGVHMFSAYIGQLLSAGIVEPDAVLHTLAGEFGSLQADLFALVPGAKDWGAARPRGVGRGVSAAVSVPSSPTKVLQRLQASSLADPWESTQYTKMFEEHEQLGRGGFGSIFRVRNKADLKFYAVKKIRRRLPKRAISAK